MTNIYQFKKPVSKNLVEAIKELLRAAENGEVESMIYLYWNNKDQTSTRMKHLEKDANFFTLLGMVEQCKIDLWAWDKDG
jgi:hypothetical protein